MSETLAAILTFGAGAMWALMLMVPAIEYAAALSAQKARPDDKIRGGWLVSASGQLVVCHTTCHAPDMTLYRENLKSRRRSHGF